MTSQSLPPYDETEVNGSRPLAPTIFVNSLKNGNYSLSRIKNYINLSLILVRALYRFINSSGIPNT